MSGHRVYQDMLRGLRSDAVTRLDVAASGTIDLREGAAFNYVQLTNAGTISLPTAADYPPGTQILVSFQAAITVDSIVWADGDWALYIITKNSADANVWRIAASSLTTSSTVDLNGVADALILDADADTTLSAPTDDQIDVEVGGTDRLTFTSAGIVLVAASGYRGQGSTIAPVVPAAAAQDLAAGGGAVTITEYYTSFDTDAGGDALTLADGAQVGQLKLIRLIIDGGGDGTLTPTNLSGGTTITFADAGDEALLMWDGTNWVAIYLGNAVDGVTAPVLA